MAKEKLPHPTDWRNRDIEDWTGTTFRTFFGDLHRERFGIPYEPFGNWGMEMKKIKTAYTTYGKPVVKRFIENEMKFYEPSKLYPGTSFGFLYTYRKASLQQAAKSVQRDEQRAKHEGEILAAMESEDEEW